MSPSVDADSNPDCDSNPDSDNDATDATDACGLRHYRRGWHELTDTEVVVDLASLELHDIPAHELQAGLGVVQSRTPLVAGSPDA